MVQFNSHVVWEIRASISR